MNKIGFELEMSDILTADAALIVHGSLDNWEDRWGGYNKPQLDYSKWNVQSDGTLKNSDGTICMNSYKEDGIYYRASNSRKSNDRLKWRGAELISPIIPLDELDNRLEEASQFIEQFKSKGAIFSSELYNSLHIHVNVFDYTKDEVRSWLPFIKRVQKGLDELGNNWKGRKFYTDEEIENLVGCRLEEFNDLYTTLPSGRKTSFNANGARRIVDIGPKFNPDKPDTIEFRCFKAIPTEEYIRACISLCVYLVDSWKIRQCNLEEFDLLCSIIKGLENG
jgi:hypothetical protein